MAITLIKTKQYEDVKIEYYSVNNAYEISVETDIGTSDSIVELVRYMKKDLPEINIRYRKSDRQFLDVELYTRTKSFSVNLNIEEFEEFTRLNELGAECAREIYDFCVELENR